MYRWCTLILMNRLKRLTKIHILESVVSALVVGSRIIRAILWLKFGLFEVFAILNKPSSKSGMFV